MITHQLQKKMLKSTAKLVQSYSIKLWYNFESLLLLVQQVESFVLKLHTRSSHIHLQAKDSNCLVLAADQTLWVYSLKGALLASFEQHTMPISSICVVS